MTPQVRLNYEPMPKQAAFHDSPAKYRLLVGGMGSGKTKAGAAEAITLCLEFSGNVGLIGRLTYPELRDSTWKEILSFPVIVDGEEMSLVYSPLIKRHDKNRMELEFWNGSLMIGRALEDAFDKVAKNLNLGFAWVDELTEVAEEMWTGITLGRLRLILPCYTCKKIPPERKIICPTCKTPTIRHTAFGTTNPEGHDWVWKTFVANPGPDHFHVLATSDENTFLSQSYLDGLAQMPPDWQKRYRHGSFDTFSGLIYPEFTDREPYTCAPFTIPEHWYHFVSIDHGYRNPTAVLWAAVSPKGRIIIYDEFYETEKRVDEIAQIIRMKSQVRIRQYLIDPATRQDKGNQSGLTIFSEFQESGIFCTPAKNQVMAGIDTVRQYLKIQEDKKPNLQIFSTCKQLRMELQTYRWKDLKIGELKNKPEKPVKKNDHACFVAGTMISTVFGEKPIESIKSGDLVYTKDGISSVGVGARSMGEKDVYEYNLAGFKLIATRDHPIFTYNRGYVQIQDLTLSDILCTMRLETLWQSEAQNISLRTQEQDFWQIQPQFSDTLKKSDHLRLNGIDRPREENGIPSMVLMDGNIGDIETMIVSNVRRNSSLLNMGGQNSVVMPAKQGTDFFHVSIMKLADAVNVVKNFLATNISKSSSVQGIVRQNIAGKYLGKKPTYNFLVEDGEYFANRVLSHNCDALRYLCAYAYDAPSLQGAKRDNYDYKKMLKIYDTTEADHWMAV